jgi:hypothetical protein
MRDPSAPAALAAVVLAMAANRVAPASFQERDVAERQGEVTGIALT